VKTVPRFLSRPGALIAAGAAAWPVTAYALASGAGIGGCVRAHGVVGFLATHGAMMRAVPSCPSATVGLPEAVDSAMALLLAAAIITTLIHVLVAALGTQAAEWVHRFAEAVARLIAPLVPTAKSPLNIRLSPVPAAQPFGHRVSIWVPWRRGPPWVAAAL